MTGIKNRWHEPMPANTLKGNDTSGEAVPQDLTVSEVRTLLSISSSESAQYANPVVETPSSTVYSGEINFPGMVFEYNAAGNLDVVSELELI